MTIGDTPQPPKGLPTGTLEERVRYALEEVRPALLADGGDSRLVAIKDGTVWLELRGACSGCPMAHTTLSDFVAERIRLYAPEIKEVIAGHP